LAENNSLLKGGKVIKVHQVASAYGGKNASGSGKGGNRKQDTVI
jgi:hypothetical protein